MLMVAQMVSSNRYCSLHGTFSKMSPKAEYIPFSSRRKLLEMLLVSVCVSDSAKGRSFTILIEDSHGDNYSKTSTIINGMASVCSANKLLKLL